MVMGKWRNKGEAQPAPAPQKNGKRNPEMRAFNRRLFDPVNATIEHADKLELQSLARAAQSGDIDAINAYRMKLMGSGLTQEEKDALGQMFMPKPQKSGRGGRIKATLPKEGPMPGGPPTHEGGGYKLGFATGDIIGLADWDKYKQLIEMRTRQAENMPASQRLEKPMLQQQSAKERMRERYGMNGPASRGY